MAENGVATSLGFLCHQISHNQGPSAQSMAGVLWNNDVDALEK